ncbi:MAG: acetyl-CoA carboxylase biotin carboxylase subunit [Planctomycetota bacterium]|nr:MAG: acetyl-CoA carboxylase biotin carboxylase subunit [Planctomycetota bacterium]
MGRIRKLLVANRGEIALRILRSCADMGIATVAVYSEADRDAPFVRAADEAVWIGPPPAAESYLSIERIIEAARRTGADAVHPGYGFLAENAAFAEACAAAGLVFIGPRPETIVAMGSKIASRRIMAAAGVPVIPGYEKEGASDEELRQAAVALGLPVLVKASAGGGGRGMRLVREEAHLAEAIAAARREARAAFGDDTLYLEKVIEGARHIEVQVLGDTRGNVVHLFERECSVQRRHQKVLEEAPAPRLDPPVRARIHEAAVTAARAVDYVGAGTVEMLLEPDGSSFYFLEMNTRLQVEHPVTEMITGLDLVCLQILIAEGEPLELSQEAVRAEGHAIECRLYAEDPDNEFLPASGTVLRMRVPEVAGIRVDAGVDDGSVVSVYYDPMIAKIIAHGPTRAEALRRLRFALDNTTCLGLRTNRAWLRRLLEHPRIERGEADTTFCERHAAELAEPPEHARRRREEAAQVAAVALALERWRRQSRLAALTPGWRNNRASDAWVAFEDEAGERLRVLYRAETPERWWVALGEEALLDPDRATRVRVLEHDLADGVLRLEIDGCQRYWEIARADDAIWVQGGGRESALRVLPRLRRGSREVGHEGDLTAPMPGKVLRVLVEPGQEVAAGDTLVILESMKMETPVRAPEPGRVRALHVQVGEQVEGGAVLVELDALEPAEA